MLRHQKLLERLNHNGTEDLKKELVLKKLLDIDPTTKKKYRNWIIDNFNRGYFKLEDTDTIRNELVIFEGLKVTQGESNSSLKT